MLRVFTEHLEFQMKTLLFTYGNFWTGESRTHGFVYYIKQVTAPFPFLCFPYTHTHTHTHTISLCGVKVSLLTEIFKLEESTTIWKVRLSLRFLVNYESQRHHRGGMGVPYFREASVKYLASSSITILTQPWEMTTGIWLFHPKLYYYRAHGEWHQNYRHS